MKYLLVADIHGDLAYINYLYHLVEIEKPTKIIMLGDISDYSGDNKTLLEFIEKYKDIIVLIKGNMDFYSFLPDEMKSMYQEVINDKVFIFTHGHLFKYNSFEYDVFVQGHTHINELEKEEDKIYFNPGSLAKPRGNTKNSYGLITDDELIIKDVDGNIIKKLTYR